MNRLNEKELKRRWFIVAFDGFDVIVIVVLTAFIVFGATTTYHTFKEKEGQS